MVAGRFGVMVRVPPPLPRWMNLLFPFTGMVWALVFGVMVLVTLIFYLLNLRKYHLSLARSFLITLRVRHRGCLGECW